MRLVLFDYKHNYDLEDHTILYVDAHMIKEEGLDKTVDRITQFKPDLLIEREYNDGVALYNSVYKKLDNIPKAWWCIDAHTNLIDHVVYAKQFDYVFCAQSWFLPIIQHEVLNKVFYLPLCHTQTLTEYEAMLKKKVKRDIGFSFIGNIRSIHVERAQYVLMFLHMYGKHFCARQADYEKTLKYLRRSKATFNCSLNNDLNFRVWEALACGAAVITDEVTDINRIKFLRQQLVLYDKIIPDWTRLVLPEETHDQEQFIKGEHTLTHRMEQMMVMIDTYRQFEYE